jgi:hypothetical protein
LRFLSEECRLKQKVISTTTHVDLHNQRFAREALEQEAQSVNNGERPLVTLMHDPVLPPIGKILEAWVEPRDDGEYQLVEVQEIFEQTLWTTLPDGTKLFKQESEIDRNPFVNKYSEMTGDYEVAYDDINFDSIEHTHSFINEIQKESGVDLTTKHFGRKSAIPDPEIIVKIGEAITTYLVAKKVLDRVGDKVIDLAIEEVTKLYNLVKALTISSAKYIRPKNRPITYVFIISKEPVIEFIVRSNDANAILSSVLIDKLQNATDQALQLHKAFDATRIQFLLNEKSDWEFNYLLTSEGAVIGTEKSFNNRTRQIEMLFPSETRTDKPQVASRKRKRRK